MYLYIWYRARFRDIALDQLMRMDGKSSCRWAWGSDTDGERSAAATKIMAPVATPFFFYLLSGSWLSAASLVITRKNPVHSALALIVTLLAQASIYLMLYAPFVAGVQIILYAGGIMVLFLFVIMLVSIDRSMRERQFNSQWIPGLLRRRPSVDYLWRFYKRKRHFPGTTRSPWWERPTRSR